METSKLTAELLKKYAGQPMTDELKKAIAAEVKKALDSSSIEGEIQPVVTPVEVAPEIREIKFAPGLFGGYTLGSTLVQSGEGGNTIANVKPSRK